MPRSFEISLPAEAAQALAAQAKQLNGVVGLAHHRGASVQPPGDIVVIQTSNDGARPVMELLGQQGVLQGGAILTSEPRSLISPGHQRQLDRETNETVWDEMAFLLRQDTNVSVNFLALMTLAGATAAVGLWADTLHLVIAAMVIAPAFEPLMQIPFGIIAGPRRLAKSGIVSAVLGYLCLAMGALAALWLLQVADGTRSSNLNEREWVQYWSSFSATGVIVSVFGAAAGAVVISGLRSVLTTGVMIALALVPSLTIVGMAIGVGDASLALRGLSRWLVEVGLVLFVGAAVFAIKRAYLRLGRALS